MQFAAHVPPTAWNTLARLRSGRTLAPFFGHKVQRAARIAVNSETFAGFASAFLDEWHGWPSPIAGQDEIATLPGFIDDLAPASQMMLSDTLAYLPGDILTKVDRASMAVSLEGRIPLLDPEVAMLAARIPLEQKIAGGTGKIILRRLLAEMVPAELFERPKAGFAVPLGAWLRGELREWAESLLSVDALLRSGLINPGPIRRRWQDHCSGRIDASQAMWTVLAFQAWYSHWHSKG